MPDEQSNLNSPVPSRRPGGSRRRGRRGGRGRGPRPVIAKPGGPGSEEILPTPEAVDPAVHSNDATEQEDHRADSSGDFREPHAEAPADFAAQEDNAASAADQVPTTEEASAVSEPIRASPAPRDPQREFQRQQRPERRPEPLRPKPWVKPADFHPAEISAISQAVAHATEIAESLKQMIDQLDEVLELVEVAERQKLADEREIDELRRALRRIQPPRRELPPPRREPLASRPPRRDEPRHSQPVQHHEEPPASPTEEEPPSHAD